jgi:hypothetical protein
LSSTALTLFVVPVLYTLLLRDPLPPEVDLDADLTDEPAVPPAHQNGPSPAPATTGGIRADVSPVAGPAV